MRDRELRVAAVFGVVVLSALLGTLIAPLWLLVLGPLIWGVPHIAADIRYLVVRTGFGRRLALGLLGGTTLVLVGAGADLLWGFVGSALVALAARASWRRRLLVAGTLVGSGLALDHLGSVGAVAFAHLHNLVAVSLWWLWRPRRRRLHLLPLLLLALGSALLLSDAAVHIVGARFEWHAAGDSADAQLGRLAPGLAPMLGMRLVLLFCFLQSVHYALWMHMIPDEARARDTVMTFRASAVDLERDLGRVGLWAIGALSLALVGWACWDMLAAGRGYYRMARFHGHLEVMAAALLVLERQRGFGIAWPSHEPRPGPRSMDPSKRCCHASVHRAHRTPDVSPPLSRAQLARRSECRCVRRAGNRCGRGDVAAPLHSAVSVVSA